MSNQESIDRNRLAGIVDGRMVLDTLNIFRTNPTIDVLLFEMGNSLPSNQTQGKHA